MRLSGYTAVVLVGCVPAPLVTEHPWPDNDWVGVVEYRGRERNSGEVTNQAALDEAERECFGPIRVLTTRNVMVGNYLYVNGIKTSEPVEGTAVIFQCVEPEGARKRCERMDRLNDSLRRMECFQRMDRTD